VLFNDATLAPAGGPRVGVIAVAKKDLEAGELIEEFGGYQVYGMAENMDAIRQERLLPIGLSIGCRLRRPVSKDAVLKMEDVNVPSNRFTDALYAEQERHFAPSRIPAQTA
jgi:predicted homoserine dehydrogenase-like protein